MAVAEAAAVAAPLLPQDACGASGDPARAGAGEVADEVAARGAAAACSTAGCFPPPIEGAALPPRVGGAARGHLRLSLWRVEWLLRGAPEPMAVRAVWWGEEAGGGGTEALCAAEAEARGGALLHIDFPVTAGPRSMSRYLRDANALTLHVLDPSGPRVVGAVRVPLAGLDSHRPLRGAHAIATRAKRHLGEVELSLELDFASVSSFELNEHMAASDITLPLLPESTQEAKHAAMRAFGAASEAGTEEAAELRERTPAASRPSTRKAAPPSASLTALKRRQSQRSGGQRSAAKSTPASVGAAAAAPPPPPAAVTASTGPESPPGQRGAPGATPAGAPRTSAGAAALTPPRARSQRRYGEGGTPATWAAPPRTPTSAHVRTPADVLTQLIGRGRQLRSRMAAVAAGDDDPGVDAGPGGIVARATAAMRDAPDSPPVERERGAAPASSAAPDGPAAASDLPDPLDLAFSFDVVGAGAGGDGETAQTLGGSARAEGGAPEADAGRTPPQDDEGAAAAGDDGLREALSAAEAGGHPWRMLDSAGTEIDASLVLALNGVGIESDDEMDDERDARSDGSSELSLREYHEVIHGDYGEANGGVGGDDVGDEGDEYDAVLHCEVKLSIGKVLVANGALADVRMEIAVPRGDCGEAEGGADAETVKTLRPSLVGGREAVFNQEVALRCARLPERATIRLTGSRVSVAGQREVLEGTVDVPCAGSALVVSAMLCCGGTGADAAMGGGDAARPDGDALMATVDAVVSAADVSTLAAMRRRDEMVEAVDAAARGAASTEAKSPTAGVFARIAKWEPTAARARGDEDTSDVGGEPRVWAVAKPLGGGSGKARGGGLDIALCVPGAAPPESAVPFAVLVRPPGASLVTPPKLLVLELWEQQGGSVAPRLVGIVRVPLPAWPEDDVSPLSEVACDVYDVYAGAAVGTVDVEVACGDVAALLGLAAGCTTSGEEGNDVDAGASADGPDQEPPRVDDHVYELTVWSLQGASWRGGEEYYVAYVFPGEDVPMYSQAVIARHGAAARFNAFAAHALEVAHGEDVLDGFGARIERRAAEVAGRHTARADEGRDPFDDGGELQAAVHAARAAVAGHVRFEVWRKAPFGDYIVATAALLTAELERLTLGRLETVGVAGRRSTRSSILDGPCAEDGEGGGDAQGSESTVTKLAPAEAALGPASYALPLVSAGTDEGASGIDWDVASLHVRVAYRPTPAQLLAHRRFRAEAEAARCARGPLPCLEGATLRLRVLSLRGLPESLCRSAAGRPRSRVRVRGSAFAHDASLEGRFAPFTTRTAEACEGDVDVAHEEVLCLSEEAGLRTAIEGHCALLELWATEGIRESDDATDMWLGTAAVPLRTVAAPGAHAAWYDVVSRRGVNVGQARVELQLEAKDGPSAEESNNAQMEGGAIDRTGGAAGLDVRADESHAEGGQEHAQQPLPDGGAARGDLEERQDDAARSASQPAEAHGEAHGPAEVPCDALPAPRVLSEAEERVERLAAYRQQQEREERGGEGQHVLAVTSADVDDSFDLDRLKSTLGELELLVDKVANPAHGGEDDEAPAIDIPPDAEMCVGQEAPAASGTVPEEPSRAEEPVASYVSDGEASVFDTTATLRETLGELELLVSRVSRGQHEHESAGQRCSQDVQVDDATDVAGVEAAVPNEDLSTAESAQSPPADSDVEVDDGIPLDEVAAGDSEEARRSCSEEAEHASESQDRAFAAAGAEAEDARAIAAAVAALSGCESALAAAERAEAEAEAAAMARSREARRARLEARAREEAIALVRARSGEGAAAAAAAASPALPVPPGIIDALAAAAAAAAGGATDGDANVDAACEE